MAGKLKRLAMSSLYTQVNLFMDNIFQMKYSVNLENKL
jgi:hypothetical protein